MIPNTKPDSSAPRRQRQVGPQGSKSDWFTWWVPDQWEILLTKQVAPKKQYSRLSFGLHRHANAHTHAHTHLKADLTGSDGMGLLFMET